MNYLLKLKNNLIDLIFPIECLGCGFNGLWVCEKCLEKIELDPNFWLILDKNPSWLDGFLVCAKWKNEILQDLIHKYKYNFIKDLDRVFVKLMVQKIMEKDLQEFLKNFVFMPVPLHPMRYAWRGFNQAELLTEKLTQVLGFEMQTKIVKRKKYTQPQVKQKNLNFRQTNIKGAFEINKKYKNYVLNKKFILVDDVLTTGSTMNEIAKILKDNGASVVLGLAIAKG